MQRLLFLAPLLFASCSAPGGEAPGIALGDAPPAAVSSEAHAWLLQFVGDWDAVGRATMEAGEAPVEMVSTESVRAFGDLWTLAEGTAEYGGASFRSQLVLGYDSAAGAFVGSWIDTYQDRMWTYVGRLDGAGRVLTLEAEGPAHDDPTRTARYRDAIERIDADHKRMVSSMESAEGTWVEYMTVDYTRRR